jgi:uncharacterized protein DUF397
MSELNFRGPWFKSSKSESGGCLQVSIGPDDVAVRQSTQPDGPVLSFAPSAWAEFIADLRAGAFQPPESAAE